MHRSAGLHRRLRQPARIAEWIHLSAATVQHGADIASGAGCLAGRITFEHLHRHTTTDALLCRLPNRHRVAGVKRRSQRAGLQCVARDLMTLDQPEHHIRRVAGQRDHAAAEIGAEVRHDLVGIVLQSRIDLPAIAPRRAPARLLRLQQHDIDAAVRPDATRPTIR